MTDYDQIVGLVPEGSAVYLLAGLAYDVRVWRDTRPRVMDIAIRVCREKKALLIFFDNVYMYGRGADCSTEPACAPEPPEGQVPPVAIPGKSSPQPHLHD